MKKSLLIISIIISAFISCTTDVFELDESNNLIPKTSNNSANKITEADALDIAGKIFHKTRSIDDYSIEYVLNDNSPKTRSIALPDTLAYILNFGNDNGFAVIATDNRVYPLLAFSESGHFEYEENENDPVYVNFISQIGNYMLTIDTTRIYPDHQFNPINGVEPKLRTYNWGAKEPFNKYINEENQGDYNVGCVGVASAQIMASCRNIFNYHDSIFNFKAIREGLDTLKVIQNKNDDFYSSTLGENDTTVYSYEVAGDKAAKFIYFLCEDLNMTFYPNGFSPAFSITAFNLFKTLGFTVNEENYYTSYFTDEKIIQLIDEKNLIYVDGRDTNNNNIGHAWVIDGYNYIFEFNYNEPPIRKNYFHCNWGWAGLDNGYYLSDFFNTTYGNFENMKYFSVKA